MTGQSTANNAANDGNYAGDADSAEYTIQSGVAATNYSSWVSNTRLQVIGMKNFYTAYNAVANAMTVAAGELGSDGYSSAYTEVKGDNASGALYTGKCTTATGSTKVSLGAGTTPTFSVSDWDDTAVMTIAFETDATADANIGAGTGGASVCAMKCSTLTYWGFDPTSNTTNLPFTYTPDGGTSVLTSTDAAAVTASLTTITVASCLGFEVGSTGSANAGNQLTCDVYYGAFPTGNATETGNSTEWACYTRDLSSAANTYSGTVVPTVAGAGTSDWDYFSAAIGFWGTAYQTLIDKRAELDIATYYHS